MPDIFLSAVPADANPNDIRLADPTLAPGGGGSSVSLAGVSPGIGSAAGALSVAQSLTGLAPGTANGVGLLSVAQSLAGVSPGIGSATGSLSVAQSLAGVSPGIGSASGALSLAQSLAGSSAGTATASGSLSVAQSLAGVSPGVGSASGNLTVDVPGAVSLAGTSAGTATTNGALTVEGGEEPPPIVIYTGAGAQPLFPRKPKSEPKPPEMVSLAGRAGGVGRAIGWLTMGVPLRGTSVVSGVVATGSLSVGVPLAGSTRRSARKSSLAKLYVREGVDPALLALIDQL